MTTLYWRILMLVVLIGHLGLAIGFYNRINGLGWPRRVIKAIVKVAFVLTILVPILAVILYHQELMDIFRGRPDELPLPMPLVVYGTITVIAWFALGVPWLMWRPIFALEWVPAPRRIEVVDVQQRLGKPLSLSRRCKLQSRWPLNQLFELAIEQIDLPVAGLPPQLDGYRIVHLSDLHLTGDVHPDFSRYVVERATAWSPQLMALTGDIIDKQSCIDWLGDIFAGARAADGCYFVLGNHDTRVRESWRTRQAMDHAGWSDLGSRTLATTLGGVPSLLIGNEHPWFQRPAVPSDGDQPFRLLLSHSPDQFDWARQHNVTLMLAGHTHGGQGRLPLIGPLLSPSFHGSRWASGDFYRPPTTLHVTRGLAGTHLLRIHCRPELSLITLRADDAVRT